MNGDRRAVIDLTLGLLDHHYHSFYSVVEVARRTGHPVPMDTRGWSQILVSVLTGINGIERKKGADLEDGSDVKGANTWEAIDTRASTESSSQAPMQTILTAWHISIIRRFFSWSYGTSTLPADLVVVSGWFGRRMIPNSA